jgi:hypothetical protein
VSVLMGNGRDPPRMTILVAKILENNHQPWHFGGASSLRPV